MTYENVNTITISKTKISFVRVFNVATKKFRGLNLKRITLKNCFPLETRSLFLSFHSTFIEILKSWMVSVRCRFFKNFKPPFPDYSIFLSSNSWEGENMGLKHFASAMGKSIFNPATYVRLVASYAFHSQLPCIWKYLLAGEKERERENEGKGGRVAQQPSTVRAVLRKLSTFIRRKYGTSWYFATISTRSSVAKTSLFFFLFFPKERTSS